MIIYKYFMKRILLFMLASYCSIAAFAQQTLPTDAINANYRIPEVPQSPEVTAFMRYGALPVNLYAGTPTISVPIYEIKGHEMSVPLSLTYDASGIKVDQLATNVGLGWNFNFAGVVSRNVQGHADLENHSTSSFLTIDDNQTRFLTTTILNNTGDFFTLLGTGHGGTRRLLYDKYQDNLIDLQPDTFSFNVGGFSGTLIIDYDTQVGNSYRIYSVEHPDIEAEFIDLDSWKITRNDGTTYLFEEAERTFHEYSSGSPTQPEYEETYESAWYLTQITSPNGLDVFDFSYSHTGFWNNVTSQAQRYTTTATTQNCNNSNYLTPAIQGVGIDNYKKEQFYLNTITHNGVPIVTTILNDEASNPRRDLEGMRYYSEIKIQDQFNTNILTVDLDNDSYFKASPSQNDTTDNNEDNSRLKLSGVHIYGTDSTKPKSYSFEYDHPDNVPSRHSNGVDFWGYYRGYGTNYGSLFPRVDSLGYATTGIYRTPNFSKALHGTLTKIQYPTGGNTTFEYGPHTTPKSGTTPTREVGGIRINKQISETVAPNGANSIETKYYYYGDIVADTNGNASGVTPSLNINPAFTGIVQQDIFFTETKPVLHVDTGPCGQHLEVANTYYVYARNRAVTVPHAITYSTVSEVIFKEQDFYGCTVHEFYNEKYEGTGLVPIKPYYNTSLLNGAVKKTSQYDAQMNLVSTVENDYTKELLNTGAADPNFYNGIYFYLNSSGYDDGQQPHAFKPGCRFSQSGNFNIGQLTAAQCGAAGGSSVASAITYKVNKYRYDQFYKKLNSSITRTYYGNDVLENLVTYEYDPQLTDVPAHYLPTASETTDSKGVTLRNEITYSANHAGIPVMDVMINRNQITRPVSVKTFRNGAVMSTQEVAFVIAGTANARDIIKAKEVKAAKGTGTLETKLFFHTYDTFGNPIGVSENGGPVAYTIWGYDGRYIIAQIANSVGPLPQTLIDAAITASNNDTSAANEAILRSRLQDIRNNNTSVHVTSYTYDPGIGLTSSTDAKGYTTYFTYDHLHRLHEVKDANSDRISKNEYGFRINN